MAAASVAPTLSLEPSSVFKYFHELTQIPRPSRQEAAVMDWLKQFAEQRGLPWKQDSYGNLVISRPGSGGGELAPTVVVQGHVDMVTEKNNDVTHSFETDPISTRLDAGWLKALGTTLGADNGVGVAAALALLDCGSDVALPPLEALFTVEEEIGLHGASALDPAIVSGRTLVNLDSEDWGVIYIGCAGAGDCTLTASLAKEAAPAGLEPYTLSVRGLQGGHSGLQIAQGLGNAVKILVRLIDAAAAAAPGLRIAALTGGDKRNAIPREASASLLLPPGESAAASAAVAAAAAALTAEYGGAEPGLALTLEPAPAADAASLEVLAVPDAARLLALLRLLPHGPVKMSHAVPGLVETSNNLASVKVNDVGSSGDEYAIVVSTRSSLPAALEASRDVVATAAELAGFQVVRGEAYAGWAPNPQSPVLGLVKEAVASVIGKEPEVTAIHAGLECGILGERLQGCDMVSYGPTILGAHSPDERLEVATVEPFWKATMALMAKLAARTA